MGGDEDAWRKFVTGMSGSVVPNIARAKVRVDDGVLREVRTVMDSLCASLADCRAKLPMKYNVWGYPIDPNYSMWNPMKPQEIKSKAPWFNIEMKLMEIGYQPSLPSRMFTMPADYGDQYVVELPPKIYWEYVKIRGNAALEFLMELEGDLEDMDANVLMDFAKKAFEVGSIRARNEIIDLYDQELMQLPNVNEIRRKADPMIEKLKLEIGQ